MQDIPQTFWIGLDSYNENDSNIFFGRDEEIQQLSNNIVHNIQTIIYGPSGIGKTSLIRAGIFKVAREKGFFPVYVRLSHKDHLHKPYYIQVIEAIIAEANLRHIDIEQSTNYVLDTKSKNLCKSLWEYFHCNEFWTNDNFPVVPLIVIDQFEEIFTLGHELSQVLDFFVQLSDLCDNKFPEYIREYVNNKENERIEYSETTNYRIVISLREDFLARLEEKADKIPALKRNRYSLQCINQEQALEIIMKPSPGLVSEEVAIQIIERVTNKIYKKDFTLHDEPDILVEPSILSLFCAELDKKRKERDLDIISEEIIGDFGDNIITDFYNQSIKELSIEKIDYLENHLLTIDGCFRNSEALQNVKNFGFTDNEIFSLINRRLIRFDTRDGESRKRIEFTHDVLCKVASNHRNLREQEEAALKIRAEEEKIRKSLIEKQEVERIKRNLDYNITKNITNHNVLIHKGRKLIDNALDFGEYRCYLGTIRHNTSDGILDFNRLCSSLVADYLYEKSNSDFTNQQVFSDPLLNDSICVISFYNQEEVNPTIDGIYGVKLTYEGALISDIHFKGKKIMNDGSTSFDSPIYILGGYCGIHIDYDEQHREIQRTYIDEDGNPVITQDGYSTIQIKYNHMNLPEQVRYFNYNNGSIIPAKHINGNAGYNSVFDNGGNEIERHFVDEKGNPTTIVSGVYAKRMTYDKQSFQLCTISNLNIDGELMRDNDGYVTINLEYDVKGKPTINKFFDEKGNPWRCPDNTYGSVDMIDYSNEEISTFCMDMDGTYIAKKDGTFKSVIKYNAKRQVTELYALNKKEEIIEDKDGWAIQIFEYDEQGRFQFFKVLNKKRQFVSGKRFEYNKEGTHVIREYALSENGIGKLPDFDVEGIEFCLDIDSNLPTLKIFINEFKQYKACNDGYNAIRNWEDNQGRTIREQYYDVDGTPMISKEGLFGKKIEYLDEHTTKYINIDSNGCIMEDYNGVAYNIEQHTTSGIISTYYNKNNEPHADDDWVYLYQEKVELNKGFQQKRYVKNSKKEHVQIWRPRIANHEWSAVCCIYDEITYDEHGRPLSQFFKDIDGQIVGDDDGDSYTIWEYDDENCIEILSLYTIDDELKMRVRTKRDNKGRVIELFYLDKDNNLLDLGRGYSGETYEYDDFDNRKIVTFINSEGDICNNKDGFAQRVHWYDNIGREIAQKDITADGIIHGLIGFREFIDSEKRECAYYLHREDGQGNIVPNSNGSVYDYYEDDVKGRTIKQLYLNEYKMPISDSEGDYGLSYEYVENKNLTIIKCLDEKGNPHNNNLGYCIMHVYEDENGKEVKRMYYDVDGTPTSFASLLGCYGLCYEYPNEHNRIVGYLDKYEEITINEHGYSYREECYNPENGINRVFYYDKERNNTQSSEDDNKDFGYAVHEDEGWRRIVSLSANGLIANNECGYAVKSELYENGKLRFYKFHDADDNPVQDNFGDYGTEVQRSDDGSMTRMISLNKKYEHHINMYGYCYCDIYTDIAGKQIRICRDLNGNQVIPKLRRINSIRKKIFSLIKKSTKQPSVINFRQIGAIYNCILVNIKDKGLGKQYGLKDTYVLLQYDNWKFGDNSEDFANLRQNSEQLPKRLVLLPVKLEGSLLKKMGDIVNLNLSTDQISMKFMEWGINLITFQSIFEKKEK